jgi:hypothetical protein
LFDLAVISVFTLVFRVSLTNHVELVGSVWHCLPNAEVAFVIG